MNEFNDIEKVKKLFKNVKESTKENIYFVAYKDMQKSSGMVSGMEYPYDGLLINKSEDGIGMFYLNQPGIVLTQNIEKMTLDKESYTFISNDEISEIKIKNYALLNSKVKRIEIKTNNKKNYKLFAKIQEKNIPYQEENFTKFIQIYNK